MPIAFLLGACFDGHKYSSLCGSSAVQAVACIAGVMRAVPMATDRISDMYMCQLFWHYTTFQVGCLECFQAQ